MSPNHFVRLFKAFSAYFYGLGKIIFQIYKVKP